MQGFYGTDKGKPTIWVWSRGYDPLLAIAHEFHHHLNLRKNGRYDTPISGESDWGLEDRLTALAKADLKRYRLEKQVARIVEKALLGVSELQT